MSFGPIGFCCGKKCYYKISGQGYKVSFYSISNDTSILITGGTGSFGKKFVQSILAKTPKIRRLVIYSRDEFKQYEMQREYSQFKFPGIRYFIGDVRDQRRLSWALRDIDVVIHAAALKHVPTAEYNPFEYVKTNVLGAQNVIESCLEHNVKKVIALSTDKAAAPINLYGATKLCSDKLFIAANNISGKAKIEFSVVRYGNVMGSRGSVIPFFLNARKTGVLPITSREMTRFNITLDESVEMVTWAIENSVGGEILVPKIPSYKIMDLANAIAPNCEHRIVGIRAGEKIHEEMITSSDSENTISLDKYYAILPSLKESKYKDFIDQFSGAPVKSGFSYSSGSNEHFLSTSELREMIKKHVDPGFE